MSSLTSGFTTKFGRIGKLVQVLSGATLRVNSGGTILAASGGSITLAEGGVLTITPQENPATCAVGQLSVSDDNELVLCTAEDTWTVVGTQS